MTLKQIAGITFAALMITAAGAHAEDMKIVKNGDGIAVKNSFGECVKAVYGFEPEGCEAAPEAKPAVKPVVTPRAVQPRVVAPVVPKPKAKGNYKGAVKMDPASQNAMQRYKK